MASGCLAKPVAIHLLTRMAAEDEDESVRSQAAEIIQEKYM